MWFWLLLLLPKINYANDEQDCTNISCDHNNVNVCGVQTSGSKEVSFRLFQDKCALQKYECETGMKGFKIISVELCNQALSLDARRDSNLQNIASIEDSQAEDLEASPLNTAVDVTDATDTSEYRSCIQCDLNTTSKTICAIRAEGERFVVRWFADNCHILLYNCEKNVNFTETDDYICEGDKNYQIATNYQMTESNEMTEETENIDVLETYKADLENETCFQDECISNNEVICAIRAEDEHFIIRWFNNTCDMLKYNCEKHVNFSVIDDFICARDNKFTKKYRNDDEIRTPYDDVIAEMENITNFLESAEQADSEITTLSNGNRYELEEKDGENFFPDNVVVSTFDMNENINQTVDNFFALTHSTGIPIQKIENAETRRMLVKNTGPINLFVPRSIRPANYTPVQLRKETKGRPEYSPLVRYCYHKCPETCPEFYKPVCAGRIDYTRLTPYLIFKNHCYMDIAKCQMTWAGFAKENMTWLEELGFVFCGGSKFMNMMYMFPLIRILQKMGRLQKKRGKAHFVMRNLGQFQIPLQG